MPRLTSEPAVQQKPGWSGAVPPCKSLPAGMGLWGSLWGIRLEISAPFPRVGNWPCRACHSFAITVKPVTCQGRACSSTIEERELAPVALISPALAECTEADPPVEGKLSFSQKVWKRCRQERGCNLSSRECLLF